MNFGVYKITWFFIIVVLLTGLFVPQLFGADAPEYASIATQMHYRNDWVNILNHSDSTGKVYDYLDKPHMLFWSALLGYKLFGVHDWTYRLFSVLLSFAGAFATFRLGKLLYSVAVGKLAAVVYMTAQAIILANHDVKTDTLLTNFVVLAVWHLVSFVQREKMLNLVWAGAFLACGVGTKGMIAVLVAGVVTFFYILGLKKWRLFYNPKWLVGVLAFFVALSPIMYFYYLQFDLHPEKFVNGGYGRSGIKFILWDQSFERFAGERNFVMASEFSFFFHSLLWAFLPWSVLLYVGSISRLVELVKTRFSSFFKSEQLTFAGTWAMLIIMSFSKFKLPHYLNVLFPFFAIFTAAYLYHLVNANRKGTLKKLLYVQYFIIAITIALLLAVNLWAFPVTNLLVIIVGIAWLAFLVYNLFDKKQDAFRKIWYCSALAILLFNFFMNASFYRKLGFYNGSLHIVKAINEKNIDRDNIYLYQFILRSFDFHSRMWRPMLNLEQVQQKVAAGEEVIVFTNKKRKEELAPHFNLQPLAAAGEYAISQISLDFVNPATRTQTLDSIYLLKVVPKNTNVSQ